MKIEAIGILVAVATVIAVFTNILQLIVAWITLKEIGDLDHDRKDWFERLPWRKYRKDEK